MIDKLYLLLYNFKKVYRWKDGKGIKEAWDAFYEDPANSDIVDRIEKGLDESFEKWLEQYDEQELDQYSDEELSDAFEARIQKEGKKRRDFSGDVKLVNKRFSKWLAEHRDEYQIITFEKIEYDHSKSPEENSRAQRDNLLIDIYYGVLTSSHTAGSLFNPGGFDSQKKASRINTILEKASKEEIGEIIKGAIQEGTKVDTSSIISALESLPLKDKKKIYTLDNLFNKYSNKLSPLSPYTYVTLHDRNMKGASMIGIAANHNANHALVQNVDRFMINPEFAFMLDNKVLTSLHEIKNYDGKSITRIVSGYLAASVDNGKDPVLADMNLNSFTMDTGMLLSRLGYDPVLTGLFLTQPIIVEMTKAYFNDKYHNKDNAIDSILKKYAAAAGIKESPYMFKYNMKYNKESFSRETLAEQKIQGGSTAAFQFNVGILFKYMMAIADDLSLEVRVSKADTSGGAAGPFIANTLKKENDAIKLLGKASSERPRILGLDIISFVGEDLRNMSTDELRTILRNSPLPYVQSYFTTGIEDAKNLLGLYFPQYNENFREAINCILSETKNLKLEDKEVNRIFAEIFDYALSDLEFFGEETGKDGIHRSAHDKRKQFITNFPQYNEKMKKHPEIAKLQFPQCLAIKQASKTGKKGSPVPVVVFRSVGKLTGPTKEQYSKEWEQLTRSQDPEVREYAYNLFRYSYYRNGTSFGPNTFIHLSPLSLRMQVPGYMERLRSIIETPIVLSKFIDQYIYNHLDNRTIVPYVKEGEDIIVRKKDSHSITIDDDAVKLYNQDGGLRHYLCFENNYYRYVESDDYEETLTYEKINPLGIPGQFIEYEYNKNAEDIKSAFGTNFKTGHEIEFPTREIISEFDYSEEGETDPLDEDPTDDQLTAYSSFIDQLNNQLADEEAARKTSDIAPNEGHVDANNNPVC